MQSRNAVQIVFNKKKKLIFFMYLDDFNMLILKKIKNKK